MHTNHRVDFCLRRLEALAEAADDCGACADEAAAAAAAAATLSTRAKDMKCGRV